MLGGVDWIGTQHLGIFLNKVATHRLRVRNINNMVISFHPVKYCKGRFDLSSLHLQSLPLQFSNMEVALDPHHHHQQHNNQTQASFAVVSTAVPTSLFLSPHLNNSGIYYGVEGENGALDSHLYVMPLKSDGSQCSDGAPGIIICYLCSIWLLCKCITLI
uniref:Uncharacterized protein n=1 Tax=Nelumbo nucifera TaxID=4432 RepID=A0A822YND8_NELNU|nr:TPA_asm: hypothetical protein HUJ06_004692 [Nelumbo nucifera]